MTLRERALNVAIRMLKGATRVAGRQQSALITARIAEQIVPAIDAVTKYGTIRFYCPGRLPEFRARTLLTKEPETLQWIDSFAAGDVLWDIGANVGSYSLYAALRKVTTLAFEPAAGNYYLLNRNIELNGMSDRLSAFCMAFSDDTRLAAFHMQNTELGGAQNSFSDALDWRGEAFRLAFEQAMIGYDIDGFIRQFHPTFPTHIKIDVDGREDKIIQGASNTLRDPRLTSLLIELDTGRESYTRGVIKVLEDAGLALAAKGHALAVDASGEVLPYLYIFRRRNS